MVEHVICKWLVLTCIFLMVCPKRSCLFVIHPDKSKEPHHPIGDMDKGFDFNEEELSKFKIWPQGIIPYFIDDVSYDKVLRDKIRGYLEIVNVKTPLRFAELPGPPRDEQTRWVFFVNRRAQLDCADVSTKQFSTEGVQRVILSYDCINGRGIAEIVLALAGVPPQHNAPDRNDSIAIEAANIVPDKLINFKILDDSDWLFHDLKYDFNSASHYDFHKYSINGQASIRPVRGVEMNAVEFDDFSKTDIEKIKMVYGYISKKKPVGKVSECSRLFIPRIDFKSYQTERAKEMIPLKKPYKYSGNLDDKPEIPLLNKESGDENVTEKDNEDKPVPVDDKNLLKIVEDKPNENDDNQNEDNSKTIEEIKLKVRKPKTHLKNIRDKLSYMSDHTTNERM